MAQPLQHALRLTAPVEFVGRTPGYAWMTQIVVRIPDELAKIGDVKVSVSARGVASNKAVVTIK